MELYNPFGDGTSSGETPDSGTGSVGVNASFLGSGSASSGDSGDVDSAGERWDGTIHAANRRRNNDGTWSKIRGRRSAGGNSGRKESKNTGNKANIDSLASILAIVHAGLASATKTPELALEEEESQALAQASANVLVEFDITPNPKVQAIVGLVMCCGSLYGPRVYLIKERWKEERADNGH